MTCSCCCILGVTEPVVEKYQTFSSDLLEVSFPGKKKTDSLWE